MPQSVAVDDAVFAKANCLPEMRKDRVYGVKIALAKEIKILAITSSTATQSQASAHIGNGTVTSNAGNSGSQVVGTGDDVVTCDESNPPLIRPADSSRAVCGDAGAANRQPGAPRPTGGIVHGLPGLVALRATLRTRQRVVTCLDSWMYYFTITELKYIDKLNAYLRSLSGADPLTTFSSSSRTCWHSAC